MYEFIINGIAVTREDFFQEIDNKSVLSDETYECLSELFETGSITIDEVVFEIKEANI